MHQELLIDGMFFGGPCDQGIGKTQHYSPYNNLLVGTAAEAGWSEFDAAIDAAGKAFETWRLTDPGIRKAILSNVASLVASREDELAELMAREIGKPIVQANAEVKRLVLTFQLSAQLTDQSNPKEIDISYDDRSNGATCITTRVPVGPILAIVPYNWPFNLAAHKLGPALAAGNTVVVKCPSFGALCTLQLGRILHEAGCPAGTVNFLNAPSALAQKAALDSRIKMVSFTGSPRVGWMLKEILPFKRVALELGGDATAIVAEDADLDYCVDKLVSGSFSYAGQICISIQHILIHETIYERFREKFIGACEDVVTGDPLNEKVMCGPVISDDSLERIKEIIEDAEANGATIVTGGQCVGRVLEPTVIENPNRIMRIGSEEVFGPVVTIQRYDNDDEAIKWVNDSAFGIHSCLFTEDPERINLYYNNLEIGGLIVNDSASLRFDAMPYGGVKRSGFGREGVTNTFYEMTEDKVLVRRKT